MRALKIPSNASFRSDILSFSLVFSVGRPIQYPHIGVGESSDENWWYLCSIVKGMKRPLSEADWSNDDLKNPQKKEEMTTLLSAQEELFGALLDQAWEREWREQQVVAREPSIPNVKNMVNLCSKF
jgi:hypothetical protein